MAIDEKSYASGIWNWEVCLLNATLTIESETFEPLTESVIPLYQDFLNDLRNEKWLKVLTSEWISDILELLCSHQDVSTSAQPSIRCNLIHDCLDKVSKNQMTEQERQLIGLRILSCSVVFLSIFVQCNWTGPPLQPDSTLEHSMETRVFDNVCQFWGDPNEKALLSKFSPVKGFLNDLRCDGNEFSELTSGVGFFWISWQMIQYLFHSFNDLLRSIFVWRSRLSFIWQQCMHGYSHLCPSPTLYTVHMVHYANALKELNIINSEFTFASDQQPDWNTLLNITGLVGQNDARVSNLKNDLSIKYSDDLLHPYILPQLNQISKRVKLLLSLELAIRLSYYGDTAKFNKVLDDMCTSWGFHFSLTGALGIRRSHQQTPIPQLVVEISRDKNNTVESIEVNDYNTIDTAFTDLKQKNWSLSEVNANTDVLERPVLEDKYASDFEGKLSIPEQLIILAKCSCILRSSSGHDDITMEELNALVQRCLILNRDQSNNNNKSDDWLMYSCALWMRSLGEIGRPKVIERACLQLQALVEQFDDLKTECRLKYFHQVCYPHRIEAKKDFGHQMMKIGGVASAFDMFKDMMMWEEAVDCLVVMGRKEEAKRILEERIQILPTPHLYCSLGDITQDPSQYEKAWHLSDCHYSRAKRSLAKWHFKQGNLKLSAEALEVALEINPMHSNSWFLLGVIRLRLQQWIPAVNAFARVVALDPEVSEAWANMAASHIKAGGWKQAYTCIVEARKHNPQNWKYLDTYVKICATLNDLQGIIEGLPQYINLNQVSEFPVWVATLLVHQVIKLSTNELSSEQSSSNNWINTNLTNRTLELFKFLSQSSLNEPEIWNSYSVLLQFCGKHLEAFEVKCRQLRLLETRYDSSYDHIKKDKLKQIIIETLQDLYSLLNLENFDNNSDTLSKRLQKLAELEITLDNIVIKMDLNNTDKLKITKS